MTLVTSFGIFSADNYRDLVIPLLSGGAVQSLVGATVQTRLKNLKTGATITGGSIDTPASAGIVRHTWADIAHVTTEVEFQYRIRVVVTFANGKQQTFPEPGQAELRVTIVPRDA